jgi:hypothetical protein
LGGWLLVGLPLALWAPELSSPVRIIAAIFIAGLTGVLIILVFLQGLNLFFGLLAFQTAATSMLIYVALLRILPRDARTDR